MEGHARHAATMTATRLPLRAVAERLSASRPRALGADQFRDGARARRTLPAAHRGHRRDALPAGIRDGDLRRPRLARHRMGASRCGGSRSISMPTAPRSRSSRRKASSIRASRAAPRSRGSSPSASAQAPWPRDPDGAPLYPGTAEAALARTSARARIGGRALRAAPRHECRDRAHRRADVGRDRRASRERSTRR